MQYLTIPYQVSYYVISHNQVNLIEGYSPFFEHIFNVTRNIEVSVTTFYFPAIQETVIKKKLSFNSERYDDFLRSLAISDLKIW